MVPPRIAQPVDNVDDRRDSHSTDAPENVTTFAHFSVSSTITLPKSAAVPVNGSQPRQVPNVKSAPLGRQEGHDVRQHVVVVSDPHMTTGVVADELRVRELRGRVLRAREGTVEIVANTENEGWSGDALQFVAQGRR